MSKNIPEELIDALTRIYSQIQSGVTFYQCLYDQDLPSIKCSPFLVRNWIPLRDAIIEGKSSALETLHLLIEELRSQRKIISHLKKKSQGPVYQLYAGSFCSIVLSAFLFWNSNSANKDFHLSSEIFLFSIFLQLLSFVTSYKIIANFKKDLNYLNWIQFMSRILLSMKWGQSLRQSFCEALDAFPLETCPLECQFNLEEFKSYLYGQQDKPQLLSTQVKIWNKCEQQLRILYTLHEQGNKITPYLKLSQRDSYQEFQHKMEEKSERSSFLLLLPLFFFQIPAFFLVLFTPLLRQIHLI